MFDICKVGNQIALLRKEKGLTQESIAEKINVSPQAISKWENGHSLPETSLLPELAKILGCSVDAILMPSELQILEAIYTDGYTSFNVTERLNKLVDHGVLSITVGEESLLKVKDSNRIWFLILKYKIPNGIYYSYSKQGVSLSIDTKMTGYQTEKDIKIVDAYYGNSEVNINVMHKMKHYEFFNWTKYKINHETFPSNPATSDKEYLSIIYTDDNGLQLIVGEENESIVYSPDKKKLLKESSLLDRMVMEGIEPLGFGKKMDCSWAGALTVALKALGRNATYEKVMGVSGVCYRLAFHPIWDYSSVDALVAYDYATPGYQAFGFKHVHAERVPKEHREEERNCIIRELNNNIPVLAINLRVAPEWGVITGYDNQGKTFLCRTYFDQEIIEQEFTGQDRYLIADNWPFIISHFEEEFTPPSDQENLVNSLKVMIDCNCITEKRRGYALGYEAYKIWCKALKDRQLFSELNSNDEDFMRRLDVNHFCVMALVDARRCAYEYLRESSWLFNDQVRSSLLELSEVYKEMYLCINQLFEKLPKVNNIDKKRVRSIWTDQLREEQADVLQRVLSLEIEAEKKARDILLMIDKASHIGNDEKDITRELL
ncbi:helix-turn-helix transcriptional regulator [Vallitalea okinawensis]|uniref:helix-turn-helix transcriptional regulator n=1 Tax=Vallitalea okinawensis TaxID=2078660 RepID=UPI000CFB5A5E|nr:helix-turn-helix transcriptional regulator [Vallitalea okinawensis]